MPHVRRGPPVLVVVRAHAVADVTVYRCVATPATWRGQEAAEVRGGGVSGLLGWGTVPYTLGGRKHRPSASEESS